MDHIEWTPTSWERLKVSQQPIYKNIEEVNAQLEFIGQEQEGVTEYNNILKLKELLQQVNNNKCLILIAGDCSEPFDESDSHIVDFKCSLLNYLAYLLFSKYNKKVVILGRIAGQYAKPRTNDYEIVDGAKIYCYRGDLVNSFNPNERESDPRRLTIGFKTSQKVKKCIDNWNDKYNQSNISDSLPFYDNFIKRGVEWSINEYTTELSNSASPSLEESNKMFSPIFICHEGLHLGYESRLIKFKKDIGKYYSSSADMLWIGERTNKLTEGHIEFFRGIINPIGIKVSTNTDLEDLIESIKILNPENEEGKIILITRMGFNNGKTESYLNLFAKKIKESNINITLICDAMHGNTMMDGKYKIRKLEDMIGEINLTSEIFSKYDLYLQGLHLELTPHSVTECLDKETTVVLHESYTTLCDPRLNFKQSIELVSRVILQQNK